MLAPTGTIGFLMDCDTTGIEPDIALVKYKLLAGGGMLKIVNRTVPPALQAPRLHARGDRRASSRTSRSTTPSRTSPIGDRHDRPQRPQARAPARLRLRLQAAPRQAQHPLPRPPPDDGRRAAVPQRRDLQDRQPARRRHRRGHRATPTSKAGSSASRRRHLPRRLEAQRPAQHQEDQRHGRRRRMPPRPAPRNSPSASPSSIRENDDLREQSRNPRPPPHAGHPHVAHPQVRDRRPRRLPHRRPVRGRPAGRTLHPDGQGRQHHRRPDGHRRHAHLAWRCNTACRWSSSSRSSPISASSPAASPRIPTSATPLRITDYVFRWLGCQFIKGYREATSPDSDQAELPMPEIARNGKTSRQPPGLRPQPHRRAIADAQTRPRQSRPRHRLHGHHLLELRLGQSHPRRCLRRLHPVRHQPGVQLNGAFDRNAAFH